MRGTGSMPPISARAVVDVVFGRVVITFIPLKKSANLSIVLAALVGFGLGSVFSVECLNFLCFNTGDDS